jgi:tRNA G18 (ribose-2'-O)-methylase SpoU
MPVVTLESATDQDPRLADFARRTDYALRVDSASSAGHGIYLVESLVVLERALSAGHALRAILALPSIVHHVEAMLTARAATAPIFTAEPELLAELTGYELHRGTVASFERPPLADPRTLLTHARRVVVIEDVVDPTNVGAIFRSVAGIGADAVLVTPRSADPFYRRAIRVSMGTVLQVPWTRAPAWSELAPLLHGEGFEIAGLALDARASPLTEYARDAADRVALVLGTEGAGLSAEALAAADHLVEIPMRHGVDSLNVAAAAAVAIYALLD